jgi:hypothetical protein
VAVGSGLKRRFLMRVLDERCFKSCEGDDGSDTRGVRGRHKDIARSIHVSIEREELRSYYVPGAKRAVPLDLLQTCRTM